MSQLNLVRHASVFNAGQNNIPIHIIGVGATGSRLWLQLVELGLTNIHAYDFDEVESHNLPNQIYMSNHIDMKKVDALRDYYQMKTGATVLPASMTFNDCRVTPDMIRESFRGVVFLLVDTMSARRELFDAIRDNPSIPLMIETRMASSYGNIEVVNPHDSAQCDNWLASLIDDTQGETSLCGTSISVGATASAIASMATWQLMHFLTNPEAMDNHTLLHLKPFVLSTGEQHV